MPLSEGEEVFDDTDHTSSPQRKSWKDSFNCIEPPVLILLFGLNLSATVFSDRVIYQVCRYKFKFNDAECSVKSTDVEKIVEPYAAKILMTKIVCESVFPAIIGLFVGTWSNKYGRKPMMLTSFIGFAFIFIIATIITAVSNYVPVNPWLYLVSIVPECLVGGNCVYAIGIYSYTTDRYSGFRRMLRMSLIEAAVYIGLALGSITASFLFPKTNATTVFIVSACSIVIATLYIAFFVKESINFENRREETFNHSGVISILKSSFKKRARYDRLILWLLISIYVMNVIVIDGQIATFYLYLRSKFEWTVSDYTRFEFFSIILPVALLYLLKFQTKLTISALTLALMSYGSQILKSVSDATATSYWHITLGIFLGSLKLFALPMVRVMISLVVPSNEFTEIIAVTNILGNFLPFAAAPLYVFVYTNTVDFYSGTVLFITTGLCLMCYLFLCVIMVLTRRNMEYYKKFLNKSGI
ncbi:hypothetical protein ACFFRR_007652 [Megaselia abdita]